MTAPEREERGMDTIEAICARRSVRQFKDKPVPREVVERLLEATVHAPSGKNRQPWRFVVVHGPRRRAEMLRVMREGIENARKAGVPLGSAEWTAAVMEHAPVTIFVLNAESTATPWEGRQDIVDIQSIGGAVQTMCLAALELGLGSLWICDVFYAYNELRQWLGTDRQMVCAVSLGYPGESPPARARRPWQEATTWLADSV